VMMLFIMSAGARASESYDTWAAASGSGRSLPSESAVLSGDVLVKSIENGNRIALVSLVRLLVSQGRMREAVAWFQGRGLDMPVTRRDLGIALSWYGRFRLYEVLGEEIDVPPDLEDDDYGKTLAAIVSMGWMACTEDGLFRPDLLVGPGELQLLSGIFFPRSCEWHRDWIGMKSLDSLFAEGIRAGVTR